mmetsp:Transcript_23829/g.72938  ORF Transcript_23829/g.72938 Transcript_23829/m.72938 type:complete len:125 (-) Transcript_23829:590-964(-)
MAVVEQMAVGDHKSLDEPSAVTYGAVNYFRHFGHVPLVSRESHREASLGNAHTGVGTVQHTTQETRSDIAQHIAGETYFPAALQRVAGSLFLFGLMIFGDAHRGQDHPLHPQADTVQLPAMSAS